MILPNEEPEIRRKILEALEGNEIVNTNSLINAHMGEHHSGDWEEVLSDLAKEGILIATEVVTYKLAD